MWGRTSNNGQTAQTVDTLPAILRVVLNNGIEMPQLGVGTSTLKETAAECVKRAIGLGYRLVDAAQGYDNEVKCGTESRKAVSTGVKCSLFRKSLPMPYVAERYASRSTGLLKHSGERMLT